MSSLHISILFTLLTIIIADNKTFYFTKSNYELWCQENILSNSLFLYPNRIPIGIYRTLNIKSVTYYLIDDNNNGLFQIKTKRLADFYFLLINITRPFDINREYQDVYTLRIEANIITTQENLTEQTEVRLYVADSNDNDGVFDMDIYEQNYTQTIDIDQSLIQFHASDADEIQHAQIFYELASSLNETFSLHPYTGELYLITKENLKSTYEFDIYAYDRYRKHVYDNNNNSIEHIGTNNGCQLAEIETRTLRHYTIKDDLCSLYHPCYHGGLCTSLNSKHGLSFTCNCLKSRFSGRQCQYDLQPCLSHPCLFNEQCISSSTTTNHLNQSYTCISSFFNLPISTKNSLYIGLALICCTFILFFLLCLSLIIYCQQQRKDKKRNDNLNNDKPLVSAPLLIQKSSPKTTKKIESPMQTLLKLNHNGKQTIETMALVDQTNHQQTTMNNFNDKTTKNQLNKSSQSIDKPPYQSHESLNRHQNDPKYYSPIGKMNIPPDNFLVHYNSIDYDTTRIPLVDPQSTDLFDFPSSPTKYFNGHKDENPNTYQTGLNSLSNLTEKLAEQNDIDLTQSSNDSSNNEQTLLTSPISNSERKRSLFNGGSTHSIRASTSSLQKAPVYAKIIKTSSKPTNGSGMSTIERLRLSGSPLRLLSSSPTYARTTSFLKSNINHENNSFQTSSSLSIKHNKINATSWKLNPRKLDSLKARRNSRHTDDDDDDNNNNNNTNNNETSQLTMTTTINRFRHASDSDLTKEHKNGKKSTKLSSFFQTEV
ncbi:unnamed protein product [Rotaria sp. Silwood2]|nr:unnamed protein product [Rotaria sp. Silwood2]